MGKRRLLTELTRNDLIEIQDYCDAIFIRTDKEINLDVFLGYDSRKKEEYFGVVQHVEIDNKTTIVKTFTAQNKDAMLQILKGVFE